MAATDLIGDLAIKSVRKLVPKTSVVLQRLGTGRARNAPTAVGQRYGRVQVMETG